MPETHDRAYSMIFTFRDDVNGQGFLARVTARGRALMVYEGDAWWLYGVEPGGMAAYGDTPAEAYFCFRETFKKILFDIVSDIQDFKEFETQARSFFREIDRKEEERWKEALAALRSGIVPEKPFDSLPRKSADDPMTFVVERLDTCKIRFSPNDNQLDEYALTEAA